MLLVTRYISSLILITAAHGLIPPSPNPALNVPLSSTSSSLKSLNLSSAADEVHPVNATNSGRIWCDGKRYGYKLDKASCTEAWEKIPTGSRLFTFGARTKGDFARPLPYRYLSSKYIASCFWELQYLFDAKSR